MTQSYDELDQLPDDLLLLIISFLMMKPAARTSVVSHKWNHLWRCFPVLVFESSSAMRRMIVRNEEAILQERANFVKWVNGVLESHLGRTIDEMRVAFHLDSKCQAHIDKWVVFALAKQVKRLKLDITTLLDFGHGYSFPKWNMSLYQTHNVSCLRYLCLQYVDITTEDVDYLLCTCVFLEDLSIISSQSLSYVRSACSSPLQLKHLTVAACRQLRTIDILAPKLLSFKHDGNPIELHIRNAFNLSKVSFGSVRYRGDVLAYAFESFSKYNSQLEYLRGRFDYSA